MRAARRGFTLVELLVVIGIIALLISILLPCLSAARRQAKVMACLAKQRDIGSAVILYGNEHKGRYPLAGGLTGSLAGLPTTVGDTRRERYVWVLNNAGNLRMAMWNEAIASYLGVKIADAGATLGAAADKFECPAVDIEQSGFGAGALYTTSASVWTSRMTYSVNEAVFGWDTSLGRLRGRTTAVRRPSHTMMLMDGQPSQTRRNPVNGVAGWLPVINLVAAPVTLGDALSENGKAASADNFDPPRHKNKVCVLFMDGHAEARTCTPAGLDDVFLLAN